MIKPSELYDKVKLPIDERLLDNLIKKYLSIPYVQMKNAFIELDKALYNQINLFAESEIHSFNQDDFSNFIKAINEDYTKAGRPFDPEKYDGIKNPLTLMPGWNIYQSWHLLGTEEIESDDIEHRFYFGINNEKLYELSHFLYEKLKTKGIPFYFKTDCDEHTQRTDNLVLYTSTPLLEKTLEVLEELQKERPDLMQNCCEPSIVVGRYSDRIGYATEDKNAKTSYTDLICKAFITAMENSLIEYTHGNYNPQIKTMFEQKIEECRKNNIDVSLKRVKHRILFNILIKHDQAFKQKLFSKFRNELVQNGMNPDNICFNNRVKQNIEQEYGTIKKIVLPNGTVMTEEEYLVRNNVMGFIPLTAKVTLGNGQVMTGQEFIEAVLKIAGHFNTFQELFTAYGAKVDRTINYKKESERLAKISQELLRKETLAITQEQNSRTQSPGIKR